MCTEPWEFDYSVLGEIAEAEKHFSQAIASNTGPSSSRGFLYRLWTVLVRVDCL